MKSNQSSFFKQTVWLHCKNLLEQRIYNAQLAMKTAQESANSEDKSSAGDKYETSRAMGQLDRDMNAKQLAEAQTELHALMKINIELLSEIAIAGSMVETNHGIYFIAAGIGAVEFPPGVIPRHSKVVILSPKAPLALAMLGKKRGDVFLFNEKKFEIVAII